jgi:hypothetical protein
MSEKSDPWLGWLILVGAAVGIWYVGSDSGWFPHDSGWFPHDEESVITAQANWFVGETKDCYSYPLDSQSATALNKSPGDAVYHVNCDDGPKHKVKITFYGRKEQPEKALVSWKCTRKEDSFICKQAGAVPSQPSAEPYQWSADPHRVSCKERPNCATSPTCIIVDATKDQCRDLP